MLLLGREANARYVSGAQRLWTAGTRPFGPGCVVVRATGAVHLVSTWDEGIPDDIPHDNLFGITWNPGNLLAWLRGIEGMAAGSPHRHRLPDARGSPSFCRRSFPDAELVDAEPALQAARRIKTPEEIEAIRTAVAVAEDGYGRRRRRASPGRARRHLAAVFMEAMAHQGVTTPATQRRGPCTRTRAPVEGDAGDRAETSWRSTPGSWQTVTSEKSGGPGRRAGSPSTRRPWTSTRRVDRLWELPAELLSGRSELPRSCRVPTR